MLNRSGRRSSSDGILHPSSSTRTVGSAVVWSHRRKQILGAILGVLLGGLLWLAPTPHGLTRVGHAVLAILVFTVIFWIFDVLGNAITAFLMLALMILAGVKPEHAMGAYAGAPFWILITVLFYGYAMQSTGLSKRVSFWILNLFPPTYGGIMFAFFLIGLVLSLGIPSMTVRTAIMVPIGWALVQSIGLKPQSRGSALLILSCVEMAMVPGFATLYGSLYGPLLVQLFTTEGYELPWLPYARALALPTIVWSLLLLAGNWLALRPEQQLALGKEYVKSELAKMGKISRQEITTGVVVAVSIAYWVGGRWHQQPAYLIGMFAIAAFATSGIIKEKDFGSAISLSFMVFLGAVFGLPDVVRENKVTDWLAGSIVPVIQYVSGHAVTLLVVMAVATFFVRFIDPAGFLTTTVVFLTFFPFLRHSPISPIVLIAPLVMAGQPFWATYQNMWIVMTEAMTGNLAYEGAHRVRLAHVYGAVSLLSLAISVAYWWALGLVG